MFVRRIWRSQPESNRGHGFAVRTVTTKYCVSGEMGFTISIEGAFL